jgi:hypothetical protein
MADQTNPQNFLVLVDTSVGACSAFNAACMKIFNDNQYLFVGWMIKALNQSLQTVQLENLLCTYLLRIK